MACNGALVSGQDTRRTADVTIAFEGVANGLSDCVVRGTGRGSYCIQIWPPEEAPEGHFIERSDIADCGGAAVIVNDDSGPIEFRENAIHRSLMGIYWYGWPGHWMEGAMLQNTFHDNRKNDIECWSRSPGIVGEGNRTGAEPPRCSGCNHCPF